MCFAMICADLKAPLYSNKTATITVAYIHAFGIDNN